MYLLHEEKNTMNGKSDMYVKTASRYIEIQLHGK